MTHKNNPETRTYSAGSEQDLRAVRLMAQGLAYVRRNFNDNQRLRQNLERFASEGSIVLLPTAKRDGKKTELDLAIGLLTERTDAECDIEAIKRSEAETIALREGGVDVDSRCVETRIAEFNEGKDEKRVMKLIGPEISALSIVMAASAHDRGLFPNQQTERENLSQSLAPALVEAVEVSEVVVELAAIRAARAGSPQLGPVA